MDKEQIATSPDLDATSEQFGETGNHDPDDLIRAKQAADKLSAELGEPLELSWFLTAAYLQQLTLSHRARARQALRWRPKFLSALAASCSFTFAARAAGISFNTFLLRRRSDPEFARQVIEAEEQAADLLQARCFKAVIEGELEPVYFQGKIVEYIRKFDSRLAIELLRAHLPQLFKPHGHFNAGPAQPVIGDKANGLICTPDVLATIQEARQANLAKMAAEMAQQKQAREIASNDATPLGTGPAAEKLGGLLSECMELEHLRLLSPNTLDKPTKLSA